MKPDPKPARCPSCGHKVGVITNIYGPSIVTCHYRRNDESLPCETSGPWRNTKEEAVAAWNRVSARRGRKSK